MRACIASNQGDTYNVGPPIGQCQFRLICTLFGERKLSRKTYQWWCTLQIQLHVLAHAQVFLRMATQNESQALPTFLVGGPALYLSIEHKSPASPLGVTSGLIGSTIEVHPKRREGPHLKSSEPHPTLDSWQHPIAFR